VDQRIFDAFASMSLQLLAELASLCHVAPIALRIKSMFDLFDTRALSASSEFKWFHSGCVQLHGGG